MPTVPEPRGLPEKEQNPTMKQSPSLEKIISQLQSSKTPVSIRMRCIFGLKSLNTPAAITALERNLLKDPSALVRHEIAYVLGQMISTSSIPVLTQTLTNANEDVMVRHEAAEALGAIANPSAVPVLENYARDEECAAEVRETCVLALERINCQNRHVQSVYTSIDPAPPSSEHDIKQLCTTLCSAKPMFQRYKAMFALRNIGGEKAVEALCMGMRSEKSSALFRHEVAYVLGQMQHSAAVPTLTRHLKDVKEHEMVRHEAAEALGSIGGADVETLLEPFRGDESDAVRESVEVALDIADYVGGDELHYAQTLPVSNEAGSVS